MALHAALVRTDGVGGVTITPSPLIVDSGDRLVWFSPDGDHSGKFDSQTPTNAQIWMGKQNQPSTVLTVQAQAQPGPFPYTVTVGTAAPGHSEVIVVGP